MAGRGRPWTFTQKIADEVCRRLAEGESLREISRSEGMPPESTVRRWFVSDVNGFAAQYARARDAQAEFWADQLLDVADDGSNDWMERNDPDNPGWQANGEAILRSRLRVDTRKWLLSKVLPKKYGDKLEVTGTLQIGNYLSALDAATAARVADDAPVEDDAAGVRH